uniref:Spermatosis associated 9 n=1 Tax=Chelonoidis abingdonii TaxID=106734 RepID=A0A8C0JBU1_CHEAB
MPIKPIGWICGQVIKRFSGQGIAVVEIIDEIKDEFPTIIGMQQSNQEIVPVLQASRSVVASAFSSSPGVRVINRLNRISTSSKSVAKVLQPKIVQNFAELNTLSHRLLKNVNIPKQPLYKNQGRTFSLFDVISYPAKTALTSIICASYAALIYMVSISFLVLHLILHHFQAPHPNLSLLNYFPCQSQLPTTTLMPVSHLLTHGLRSLPPPLIYLPPHFLLDPPCLPRFFIKSQFSLLNED